MAFELDPLFHTETMAKILQSQGHVQLALKVCHQILERDPANQRIKELSEKWKTPFGRAEAPEESPRRSEDEDTEPGITLEELQASEELEARPPPSAEELERERKLEKLQTLLRKIQERA
jgi:hypothetical protein